MMTSRWKNIATRRVQTSAQRGNSLRIARKVAKARVYDRQKKQLNRVTDGAVKAGKVTYSSILRKFILASVVQSEYALYVPEKKGTGFGSLNTQSAHAAQCGIFVCACLRAPSMSGDGGEAFGPAGLFGCQSSNPAICRSPRLEARGGLTATQGGHYA